MFAVDEAHAALELSSGWFLENLWLIALIPAIAFALIMMFGKRMPRGGSEFGLVSIGASLVLATGAAIQWMQRVNSAGEAGEALGLLGTFGRSLPRASEGHAEPFIAPVVRSWTWWESSGLQFGIGSLADGLSVMLLWLVAFISLLVQIFSLDYVRGDRRYTQFFGALTLFSAGMLVMVMAENMVQLILGWEIMGLCSFMLIGHWWEEEANSRAALKAFFTVRVGDVGLLVGTAIVFFGANGWAQENLGSNGFNIYAIQAWALSGDGSSTVLLMAAIALFIACIGKSGQFPLHTWLPDAMAGPTPVSSLLHSSTMVVAGVFLVARVYPVFWSGFSIGGGGLNLIAVIGGITIIIAALLAFVQDDIKKVLAYSTVSQLGYMMLGLGVGAWLPAVFHVLTHAFFKCCLFLCAGSISHSGSHHSFDMKADMGGLRKYMPVTFGAWIVSTLALTGVFPFAGFWSKDEIIDNVGHNGYTGLYWTALFGAALTAMYMVRATYLTFFGSPRGAAAGHTEGLHHGEHGVDAEEFEMTELTVGAPVPRSLSSAVSTAPGAHDGHDGHGHDDHGHGDHGHDDHGHGPHESGPLLLVPIVILAVLATFSGFANATPLGENWEQIKKYVEPRPQPVLIDAVAPSGPGHSLLPAEAGFIVESTGAPASSATLSTESEAEGDGHPAEEGEGHASGCGYSTPEPGTVCFSPTFDHAKPEMSKILLSLAIVGVAYLLAIGFCISFYGRRDKRLVGLTDRNVVLRGGYVLLKNKYYLDRLYENGIVHAVAHPIAKAAYWFNQHVLDATVNAVGEGAKNTGTWVYDNIDQGLIDGAVNASGTVASETGHELQGVQSGKVNQYGALLFGAATVAAIVLVILNAS